jgi:hypothetical protein
MIHYQAVVHSEALKPLLAASARERMRLIQFLERLELDPFREGDFQIQDESGRTQAGQLHFWISDNLLFRPRGKRSARH